MWEARLSARRAWEDGGLDCEALFASESEARNGSMSFIKDLQRQLGGEIDEHINSISLRTDTGEILIYWCVQIRNPYPFNGDRLNDVINYIKD